MTIPRLVPAPKDSWLPLVLITVLSIAIFIVSIISLLSGWLTIFQNLFYFPIILACVYYVKRGFIFSVLLACSYFVLMLIFSRDPVVLEGALIRVLIFILVAGVITYLSIVRIRAEDALKESEEFNRGLVENMPNLVMVYDHNRKIRYVNPAATTLLGYSSGEMEGTDIMTYVNPPQHAEIAAATEEQFSSGRGESLEVDLISKTGRHLTVISKGAPLNFQNQPAVLVLLADISDRKQAESALLETNAYLNNLFNYANAPIITWDSGFHITRFNHAFEDLTGRNEEEVLGKTLDILFPDDSRTASMALIQKAFTGERWKTVEIPILTKDGTIRTVIWNSANILDPRGRTISTIAQGSDITERKQAESALRQANKQLNLLSSITRHDILNQLMVLMGYLELSNNAIDKPETLKDFITKEQHAAKTIEHQIRFTKDYQDMGVAAPVWQNVNDSIKKDIPRLPMRDVQVEIDRSDLEIFSDPLFPKVFYNLIDNALRYGGDGMKTIRVSSHETDTGLLIICEDDGVGISEEDKTRLFTKGFGRNTGLGLFLSREILAITGITITENGVPGRGARFEMTVPKGMYRLTGTREK